MRIKIGDIFTNLSKDCTYKIIKVTLQEYNILFQPKNSRPTLTIVNKDFFNTLDLKKIGNQNEKI